MSEIRVEEIHIHPVKSCRRIEVNEIEILATGLAHDREWQVVDAEGACVTQRKYPSLATIETALDGDSVILSASGRDSTTLSRDGALPVTVQPLVGRRPVNGVDAGDEGAAGISDFLGEQFRFAAVTDDSNHHAPSSIDLVSSGITFFSSKYFSTPKPSHSVQAPCGALKLNNLGSISSIEKPDIGHENLEE